MAKITKITASYIKHHITNAPHFFDAKTLAFFGQKLSSFKVTKTKNPDVYYLSAPMIDFRSVNMGLTERWFDIRTNKFIEPEQTLTITKRNINMTTTNLTNFHSIQIKYLGATNTKGSRIKLISSRFDESITLERDYSIEAREQAIQYLVNRGFELIGACENGNFIISSTFKGFKND